MTTIDSACHPCPRRLSTICAATSMTPTNPVRDTGRLRKPRRAVVALTDENLQAVRTAIRDWQRPIPGKPGPRHNGDQADVVDLMLATGARIGELLALRWEDLDLAAERPSLTICGTLVFVKGQGFFRQPWTKRPDSNRRPLDPGTIY
ncbi:hypothetical protein [Micromonospora sp. WMMC250]|uniref:hypothetical protein n=1 Tax=Micromonospora sp. WMMC250 TaxID=3014781 RepID=UPI0022B66255|nr:hypothetical protein [Micromonospora sp. WMMC250]MCZ7375221.1 hypothetical protein [Micromonospora sp. WMMC250]